MSLTREQIVAFRLNAQHLTKRLPAKGLTMAAGGAPQNTPPGSATLGLRARADVNSETVESAISENRSLVQVWSLRGSPCLLAAADMQIFTLGIRPDDDESWRALMQGFLPIIDDLGESATRVAELVTHAVADALDGRVLTKRELGVELGRRLPRKLGPWFDAQTFSTFSAIVVRAVSLAGTVVITPRVGAEASFTRTDQWLGKPRPVKNPRAESVRRYLSLHGPSTVDDFASWAGISAKFARRSWDLVSGEITETGNGAHLLTGDVPALDHPPVPRGVRMIPPYDPYLQQRDRLTAVPDEAWHKRIWKSTGNPGVVLRDGEVAALWRQQKKGTTLMVTVEALGKFVAADREAIRVEADAIAPFRGCAKATVQFA